MTACSAVGLVDEGAGRLDDVGVALERPDQRFHLVESVEQLGILLGEPEEFPSLLVLYTFEFLGGAVVECLLAPHTERFRARCLLLTARAGDRRDGVGFVGLVESAPWARANSPRSSA